MISVLCWNVRGIGGLAYLRRLKKLCRIHNFSILFLIEPFLSSDNLSRIASSLGFSNFLAADSGKILVFWRHNFSLSLESQTDQLLHFDCCHPSFHSPCHVTNVQWLSGGSSGTLCWIFTLWWRPCPGWYVATLMRF